MHVSNVQEHGVANAIFVATLLPKIRQYANGDSWGDAIDAHFEKMFTLTFGNMIRELIDTGAYSKALVERLHETKTTRDHLVHHFHREAAELMLTPIGRKKMIEKYLQIIGEFGAADEALEAEIGPIRNRHGVTDDWLNEAYEDGIRRLVAASGDGV